LDGSDRSHTIQETKVQLEAALRAIESLRDFHNCLSKRESRILPSPSGLIKPKWWPVLHVPAYEQVTGLPVHINADFFPESDRKAIVLKNAQHEQAWNEALIHAAAARLADALESLRDDGAPLTVTEVKDRET
jgi:hypothetical protein